MDKIPKSSVFSNLTMIHNMKLKEWPFKAVKNGTKTIEMRLYDDKRHQIKIGDQILFTEYNGTDTVLVEVVNLHLCPSFADLYEKFDKVSLGYAENEIAKPEDMTMFYPIEEQKQFGVVGIEIKKVDE